MRQKKGAMMNPSILAQMPLCNDDDSGNGSTSPDREEMIQRLEQEEPQEKSTQSPVVELSPQAHR